MLYTWYLVLRIKHSARRTLIVGTCVVVDNIPEVKIDGVLQAEVPDGGTGKKRRVKNITDSYIPFASHVLAVVVLQICACSCSASCWFFE